MELWAAVRNVVHLRELLSAETDQARTELLRAQLAEQEGVVLEIDLRRRAEPA